VQEGVTIKAKDRPKPVLDLELIAKLVIYKGYKA